MKQGELRDGLVRKIIDNYGGEMGGNLEKL